MSTFVTIYGAFAVAFGVIVTVGSAVMLALGNGDWLFPLASGLFCTFAGWACYQDGQL